MCCEFRRRRIILCTTCRYVCNKKVIARGVSVCITMRRYVSFCFSDARVRENSHIGYTCLMDKLAYALTRGEKI